MQSGPGEKVPVACLCHPTRPGQMTVVHAFGALALRGWIEPKHDARHLAPIGAVGRGIQQTQVGHRVRAVGPLGGSS